jgi:choline-glycine betaine transporter
MSKIVTELGNKSEQDQVGISWVALVFTVGSSMVIYAILSVVWAYSTFATQKEIETRAAARQTELNDLKTQLGRMDSKLDQIILNQKH